MRLIAIVITIARKVRVHASWTRGGVGGRGRGRNQETSRISSTAEAEAGGGEAGDERGGE